MYTQNTPIHVKLWHRDFWLLSTANLLMTIAMYMQFLLLPQWFIGEIGLSYFKLATVFGLSGIGLFALGCFCSYWVQRYRRSRVCINALFAILLSFCALYFLYENTTLSYDEKYFLTLIVRFIQGAAFCIAHIVLSGTLIIDACESFRRTEANHSSAWFTRFALSLGPALTIVLLSFTTIKVTFVICAVLCLAAALCILLVNFPFKAPEDTLCKVSLDRFFLPQGKWLFLNLTIITTVIGLLISSEQTITFYGMMMVGFFLALLSQRFVFINADLKSEITVGLILILVSLLLHFSDNNNAITFIYPVLAGCGIGIIGARFLLFFIKLKGHCQRSTSQSTYFLSWEFGLSVGLFLGYAFFNENKNQLLICAMILSCLALIMYLSFTHSWYIKNKDR